jgi:hypothetical protein
MSAATTERTHPHETSNDGRKIVAVGPAYNDDDGYADEKAEREIAKRVEVHAAHIRLLGTQHQI